MSQDAAEGSLEVRSIDLVDARGLPACHGTLPAGLLATTEGRQERC